MAPVSSSFAALCLFASAVSSKATIGSYINGNTPAQKACNYLASQSPNATHFPNSTYYETDNTDFWTAAAALGPACDFAPSCAEDLGWAVKVLRYYGAPFAMRGGGHMPIEGFNNINSSGVLLSSSGFTQLRLEPDGESVHIGPSNHWVDVYRFLEPVGKVVVGGRLGVVGIPGFVTGGGISFFGWQHGWSSNNLKSYTVVLADGSVVKATPNNTFADLFWALRGGGNSFGLVTDIEMKTYDAPVVTLGITSHGTANISDKYADAVYDFAVNGSAMDAKSAIIPIINTGNISPFNKTISYTTYRFHDGNDTNPPALASFTSPNLPVESDTFAPKTMYKWSEETAPTFEQTHGLRERFYLIALYANKQAYKIVVDTYFDMVFDALADFEVWFTGVSPIPVSKRFLAASQGPNGHGLPDGDPMGAPAENYYWVEFAITYSDKAEYEPVVTKFLQDVQSEVTRKISEAGLDDKVSKFLYLNDVDKGQDLWGGYPKENVKRLQCIREKYDPDMIFTKQMPGGWKVADAKV